MEATNMLLSSWQSALGTTLGILVLVSTFTSRVVAQVSLQNSADVCDRNLLEGENYFNDLRGMEFSDAQLEEFNELEALFHERISAILENASTEEDPNAATLFIPHPDVQMTLAQQEAVSEAFNDVTTNNIDAFNLAFSQYGEFSIDERLALTSEEKMQVYQLEVAYSEQTLEILTAEQQQKYQANVEARCR